MGRLLQFVVCLVMLPTVASVTAGDGKGAPMKTVDQVDLKRYVGRWYEIARLPNRFQKICSRNVSAEYSVRKDGRIDVVNRCSLNDGEQKTAQGVARIVDDTSMAKLKVRFAPAYLSFLPMVWGNYWVLDLAPDYSYAVVGEPSRKFLWVLAREPKLDAEIYRSILERVEAQGYDANDLVRTPHDGL